MALTRALGRRQRQLVALDMLLDHPEAAMDSKLVCTMLQVCHGWREVVRRSKGSHTCIDVPLIPPLTTATEAMHKQNILKLAALAEWLKEYPYLVGSISIGFAPDSNILRPVLNLMLGSLQYVAEVTRAAAAAAEIAQLQQQLAQNDGQAGSAAADQGMAQLNSSRSGDGAAQQQLVAWRLREFSCCVPVSSKILTALPVATLTALKLNHIKPQASLSVALAQLTQLRQLTLDMQERADGPSIMHMIEPLTALAVLTRLSLYEISAATDVARLPQQLQHLTLHYHCEPQPDGPHIDLETLTALQSLRIGECGVETAAAHLPSQLQQLEVHMGVSAPDYCKLQRYGISQLHQLQQLYVQITDKERLDLLAGLRQLRQLVVVGSGDDIGVSALMQARSVFCQLPELDELGIDFDYLECLHIWELMHCISHLTKLSGLSLCAPFCSADGSGEVADGDAPSPAVWNMLAALTSLVELKLDAHATSNVDDTFTTNTFMCRGVTAIAQLTGLTCLALIGEWSRCFDSLALSHVISGLSRLEVLQVGRFEDAEVWNITPLISIGHLVHLRFLWYCYGRSWGMLSSFEYWQRFLRGKEAGMRAWRLDGGAANCGLAHDDARQGLSYLTGLSRLTELRGFASAGSEALEGFWAQVRT